jgi:predicted alpha/beta-hydrolase family hydrolase
MLLADQELADGLLLLSYPLHPPSRPAQARTQHLPKIQAPTLFVHGTKDPFGSIEEIESARKLIPARTELVVVESAGHDLGFKRQKQREDLPHLILARSREFFEA